MKQMVEFPLQSGGSLIVETESSSREGPTRVSRPDGPLEKAALSFEEAISKIRPAAEHLVYQLRDLTLSPDQITIEFGIKLNAEAGALIAKASAEGTTK